MNPSKTPRIDDATIITIENLLLNKLIINILIGAIFCQVTIIKQFIQSKPSITSGNHEWKGAIPNFMNRAEWNINKNTLEKFTIKKSKLFSMMIIEKINIVEAKAWIMKYFKTDSLELLEFILVNRGINDNKLISIPNHIINQEYDDKVIKEPKIIEIKNNNLWNLEIKKGEINLS